MEMASRGSRGSFEPTSLVSAFHAFEFHANAEEPESGLLPLWLAHSILPNFFFNFSDVNIIFSPETEAAWVKKICSQEYVY